MRFRACHRTRGEVQNDPPLGVRPGVQEEEGVSVDHLIHGGLLVPRACHDVLVVPGDVTTEHGGGLLGLWTGWGWGGESEVWLRPARSGSCS